MPPGGENWIDVYKRSDSFLDDIIVKYVKKDYIEKKEEIIKSKTSKVENKKVALTKQVTILPEVKYIKINPKNVSVLDNTISIKKSNTITSNTSSQEYQNLTEDLEQLFSDFEFKKKMLKVYQGINTDINIPRILIVSHGSFIMELLNSIRTRKNIRIKFVNDSKNSALYVFKIYCIVCGVVCYSKSDQCQLEYDSILFNDIDHLGALVKIKNDY